MNPNPYATPDYFCEDELRTAARIVAEAMLDSLPQPEACHHDVSPDFLSKMAPLLAKAKRRECARRWTLRTAAALLALVIGATSWLAVDTQARAAFFAWVREVCENSVVYCFFHDTPAMEQLPDYQPGWVPDGYQLSEVMESDVSCTLIYQDLNHQANVFIIGYRFYHENMNLSLMWDTNEYELFDVQVNHLSGHFYQSVHEIETNNLVWVNPSLELLFTIEGHFQQDVMLHIAESINLVN